MRLGQTAQRRSRIEEPITVARVERALMVAAYVVVVHGAKYTPLFRRLEKELAELRQHSASNPVERAAG
jgi:hypothetical protein